MKLKDQVCSLELAKRLKELGIKQISLCYWWQHDNDCWDLTVSVYPTSTNNYISAFTVAELGEMLPHMINTYKGNREWKWECSYNSGNDYHSKSGAETEADARAKMLIYLLENKLIEINI